MRDVAQDLCYNGQVSYPRPDFQRIRKRIELVKYLLDHPCVDCGEDDICCLDFDHLRNKRFKISRMLQSGHAWKTILPEIKKCVVRCANCHRKKTIGRPAWFVDVEQFGQNALAVTHAAYDGIPHGKRHGYTYHKCRCPLCTKAQRDYMTQFRAC